MNFDFTRPGTNFMRKYRRVVHNINPCEGHQPSTYLRPRKQLCGLGHLVVFRETHGFSLRKSRSVRRIRTTSSKILYRSSKKMYENIEMRCVCDRQARYLRPCNERCRLITAAHLKKKEIDVITSQARNLRPCK
jgi:hypothetical protein